MSKKFYWVIAGIIFAILIVIIVLLVLSNKYGADALNSMQKNMANVNSPGKQTQVSDAMSKTSKNMADKTAKVLANHNDYKFSSALSKTQSTTIWGEINPIVSGAQTDISNVMSTLGYKSGTCTRVTSYSLINVWSDDLYPNQIFIRITITGNYGQAYDDIREGCLFQYGPVVSTNKKYSYANGKLIESDVKDYWDGGTDTQHIIARAESAPMSASDIVAPESCCPKAKPSIPQKIWNMMNFRFGS